MPDLKIFILSDYFFPAQNAGGITRSLTYICRSFSGIFDIYVVSSAFDLGTSVPMSGIHPDQWQDFEGKAKVFYALKLSMIKLYKLITEVQADVIYVNGIFSLRYNLFPLLLYKFGLAPRVVVAPRGMLQQGALAVKSPKKKLFLFVFILLGLHRHIIWHATDAQEKEDINRMMGQRAHVVMAEVSPDLKSYPLSPIAKTPGDLKLVFISLLTAKKNLKYLLQTLKDYTGKVHLAIYGPVKDLAYWQECQALIRQMPAHIHIQYKGPLPPEQVMKTLLNYHFFILPTLGENFGHAIYEALNAGRPVIISDRTPWRQIQEQEAGWDFDLEDTQVLLQIVQACSAMDQSEYDTYCRGAQSVARKYREKAEFEKKYKRLFTTEP